MERTAPLPSNFSWQHLKKSNDQNVDLIQHFLVARVIEFQNKMTFSEYYPHVAFQTRHKRWSLEGSILNRIPDSIHVSSNKSTPLHHLFSFQINPSYV